MNNLFKSKKSACHSAHTIRSRVKTALAIGAVSLLSFSSLNSTAADYSRAEKELKIMSKIFEASISEGRSNGIRFGSSNKATYLAKQGMVFSFNFGRSNFANSDDWQAFGEGIGQLVGSISAEIVESIAEVDVEIPRVPRVAPIGSDWEDNIEAYEAYQEAMEDMRDEQRDKREEVRELQRSIREMERQARKEEEVDTKKLEITKKKLEEKLAVLEQKMKQYEASRKEYKEKKLAKYKLNNQKKSDLIVSTLCDYGATLRSLKNGEYVTLIFNGFDNGKDQVYVFNYKDVKTCENKEKLLNKAISYQL